MVSLDEGEDEPKPACPYAKPAGAVGHTMQDETGEVAIGRRVDRGPEGIDRPAQYGAKPAEGGYEGEDEAKPVERTRDAWHGH